MNTYLVSIITDLMEEVSVYVEASDEAEAEEIGLSMLERGELNCVGLICLSAHVDLIEE